MNPSEENWFLDQNNKIFDESTVSKEKQHNQSQTLSGAKPQVNDAKFTTDHFQLKEVRRCASLAARARLLTVPSDLKCTLTQSNKIKIRA